MPDYPPGYDPSQADYTNPNGYVSPEDQAIGGLLGLSAFGMIGIGAFFTFAAVEAGEAVEIFTVTFELEIDGELVTATTDFAMNGVVFNQAQLQFIAVVESGGFATEVQVVTMILQSWGLTAVSVDSFLALAAYDETVGNNPGHFGNFGHYLGGHIGGTRFPGGSDFAETPGFPGFPGGGGPQTGPWSGGHRTAVCYEWSDGTTECFFEN